MSREAISFVRTTHTQGPALLVPVVPVLVRVCTQPQTGRSTMVAGVVVAVVVVVVVRRAVRARCVRELPVQVWAPWVP